MFKKLYYILQAVWGLYQLARECHQLQKTALRPSQQLVQTSPPLDKHVLASATRPILIRETEESPLLISLSSQEILAPQQDRASAESELVTPQEPLTSTTEQYSISETLGNQVKPVLGTTFMENQQLQDRNRSQDITDILGTAAYEGYVQTPIQTLDGIYVNQLKHFLPLAKKAKCLAEEIRKENQAEQWTGIPHEKLLNQSFLDQLNSLQILEQLAPLQLAKEHLPSDIIDILERLRKVDNIFFNQLYYIAENCADRYYSKVIQAFVFIIKRQFTDRQTLLINTARSLKFLEEYADRQAQIWKILRKYHNLPDNVEDLHFHFDSFKSSIETDFKHLKEATSHNVQNIHTSLGIQQTYSSTLCSHVNNIHNKLS